ncbi:succinate dehydrogenase cytochrome b558 subunit [Microaerobacter geothermalis]|uniref:succinate dehydrogenase cytochrome b558 subunit n=1 Tax=Microaerobacter geothermalis TaxID=674972 RepID=UPI001F3794B0|nr:succinate dehydrogenase cytochrome b558 subunit [Microaerobacter geothermalis]MCF6092618.1 succinate dehydrogenase cytochrome b558 subunit [Microaerobacter geothermalis]
MENSRHFFYRKLHSLTGVIPVGIFLLEHLYTNYFATRGVEAYNQKVAEIWEIPFLLVFELLIIGSIIYHGIYGLYIAFQAKHNVGNYSYFRNVMFMLQRVTGVITLIYITWHVWETRVQVALGNVEKDQFFELMTDILSNPWMLTFYIIGLVSAVFHFSNGMWSFLVTWGITIGPRSQQISTYVWMTLFVVLSSIGIYTLLTFVNVETASQLIR